MLSLLNGLMDAVCIAGIVTILVLSDNPVVRCLLAGGLGVMLWIRKYEAENWRRSHHYLTTNGTDAFLLFNRFMQEATHNNIRLLLQDFFGDSPIQNYVIQLSQERGLVIKIGDDDVIVEVDMQQFATDHVAALERARTDWMAAKAMQNDLGTQGG